MWSGKFTPKINENLELDNMNESNYETREDSGLPDSNRTANVPGVKVPTRQYRVGDTDPYVWGVESLDFRRTVPSNIPAVPDHSTENLEYDDVSNVYGGREPLLTDVCPSCNGEDIRRGLSVIISVPVCVRDRVSRMRR